MYVNAMVMYMFILYIKVLEVTRDALQYTCMSMSVRITRKDWLLILTIVDVIGEGDRKDR